MGKKYYCFSKKQEMVVINILFCVLCFLNREDYYHRNSASNKGSVSGLTDLERSRQVLDAVQRELLSPFTPHNPQRMDNQN